jgi:hypothetical protein
MLNQVFAHTLATKVKATTQMASSLFAFFMCFNNLHSNNRFMALDGQGFKPKTAI